MKRFSYIPSILLLGALPLSAAAPSDCWKLRKTVFDAA